jgi:ACT domain-containing protein
MTSNSQKTNLDDVNEVDSTKRLKIDVSDKNDQEEDIREFTEWCQKRDIIINHNKVPFKPHLIYL